MAKSAYEYVKNFELNDTLLPNTWIVVRVDGKNFHKLSDVHHFEKPNDKRALDLMNKAAVGVMKEINDIILAYGVSDEFSFILDRTTKLFNRRSSKILTTICSLFTSAFVFEWNNFFPNEKLHYFPSFDGRVVLYPTNKVLRDYLSFRQVDCHINNLLNTTFWALVQKGGLSREDATHKVTHTVSSEKHEILFGFGINYNKEKEQFKKGTFVIRNKLHKRPVVLESSFRTECGLMILHNDIIGNDIWEKNPHVLGED